jgi:hypothetical protein
VNEDTSDLHHPASVPLTLIGVWMVLFRKDTGEITQVMMQSSVTAGMLETKEIGLCEIPGVGPTFSELLTFSTTHYVDTAAFFPQIRDRLACPAALDGLTLRGLPLPCQIEITAPLGVARVYEEADSPTLEITFDHPGTYTITVRSSRYLPGVFTTTYGSTTDG